MPSISERSPFEIIVNLGCVYKSPVDRSGNYLGPPLIAYNRTYFDIDGKQKNYVGFCYYNTDLIKQSSEATKYFSNILAEKIKANLPLHRHIITAQQEDFILTSTIADKLSYSKLKDSPDVADTKAVIKEFSAAGMFSIQISDKFTHL